MRIIIRIKKHVADAVQPCMQTPSEQQRDAENEQTRAPWATSPGNQHFDQPDRYRI